MEIIPAIDMMDGKCVRLVQGRFDQSTVFSDDPVDAARRWVDEGAVRLLSVFASVGATGGSAPATAPKPSGGCGSGCGCAH